MFNNKADEPIGIFPKKKTLIAFLLATLLLLIGTGMSVSIISNNYYKLDPRWDFLILLVLAIQLNLVNFKVTRGSFLCAKWLKFQAIMFALICAPAILLQDTFAALLFCLINMAVLIGAVFLISGEKYKAYVQYQHDLMSDINEARDMINQEINEKLKRKTRL
ncbi:hypothetical protein [Shewanella salipaludis]|uniref:Uncharacterized protein n=1 Tax=Shewanella salipaludis TaxID=2723052 RepID=A0A972FZW1_9GAMM|nr:hypothetical protein [Shewanella salipaludis]NMH66238.1 hypothetical protein [Shewanella salipaludis]